MTDRLLERLLTARELAEVLGVSASTVLDWFEAGRLPGFRLNGRAVRFRGSEIAKWLEEQRAPNPRRLVSSSPSGIPSGMSSSTSSSTGGAG